MKRNLLAIILGFLGSVVLADTPGYQRVNQTDKLFSTTLMNKIATIDQNDTVIFDLSKALVTGNDVAFPVSILSDDTINSLDFRFKYDHANLTYDSIVNLTTYIQPLSYYNAVDSTVRFTSYSFQQYSNAVSLVDVHFTLIASQISTTDIYSIASYLNGDPCTVRLINALPSGLEDILKNIPVKVYPNPSNGKLFVETALKSTLQILSIDGREVILQRSINANQKSEINTSGIANGIYLVKIFNDKFSKVEKISIFN